VRFAPQLISVKFLILKRIRREFIVNIHRSSSKVSVILVRFKKKNFNFLDRFAKFIKVLNFTKIPPVGAESFQADKRTDIHIDRYDKVSSPLFFHNFTNASKNAVLGILTHIYMLRHRVPSYLTLSSFGDGFLFKC
jgi:hypothetical protein